jgi:ribosomal protein L37E
MEGFKNNNDGLDFVCEICGDREGGCQACGFGDRQKREKLDSPNWDKYDDKRPATQEDFDKFANDIKEMFGDIK